MEGDAGGPRAVAVVRQGDTEVRLAVDRSIRCDLGLVDDLLRVRLHARRLGWTLSVTDVRPDLQELFDLVGLTGGADG